ncbi:MULTISPECIES: RnfABCDGE type electron transport complex subunit B [unclassified Psychrobacter]|uniref:RnfABCDGE type electron transport complex subunit B n=1 Tax=unclassified Psychrobacter TaxID=196806 RepID=UPI0008687554|nr:MULTISPECIES: RnfABCDGE type electron transport complex subunit B [unclassified Psychrobacter]OEH66970.1 MAG: iron-sulfur protein [Psychrobacter sp. B29-1]PKG62533.1 iron-sulfur protein [Psychrobacter sp. Choline-02u-13]PKH55176.1 iron-sulfur protein [Psychrobacter sp. Choline-02u-9]TEW88047.1 RnfABCDGE type electron transport complex subunit B [Psychrobacter sp. 230]|tara:strand:- start:66824 stop:67669 length:846 start_codon:yes stop_codon:yes gene_type:complete
MQSSTNIRLVNLPILFDTLHIDTLPADIQAKIARVDACLPQTQCGLCEHPDGCLPYAAAIVLDGEPYNKCVPGGQPVTNAIAQTLDIDTPDTMLTAVPSQWPIDATSERPTEVRAVIREDDCIGCTKCIPACPVDAIVGTGKHMHTIFTDLCTGCELCIAPCPVDCIDLVTIEREISEPERIAEQEDLRQRYHTHLKRVTEQLADTSNSRPVVSMVEAKLNNAASQSLNISESQAKNTIAAAKLRTKIKKLEKQLSVRVNDKKQAELDSLQAELESLQVAL